MNLKKRRLKMNLSSRQEGSLWRKIETLWLELWKKDRS